MSCCRFHICRFSVAAFSNSSRAQPREGKVARCEGNGNRGDLRKAGYEPKCGHCAALMPAGNASCRCGEAGRSAVCRACSTKKLEGEPLPQKAGDARRLRKRGADAVHQREVWLLKFGEAPNSWCGGSSPTASARLHTLHSACLSCRVGGVRVSS